MPTPRSTISLFLIVFVDFVGFGIVLPLQPLLALEFGASPGAVTLVAASFTAAQFVSAPLWGRWSDRVGRRRVILLTTSGGALAYVALAFSGSLAMLFAARAFAGAMAGNMAVAHAYAADVSAPEHRAKAMARLGAAGGLGFVVGPAVGGLLAGIGNDWAVWEAMGVGGSDYRVPFLAGAAFSGLAFVLAAMTLREPKRPEEENETPSDPLSHAADAANRKSGWRGILTRPILAGLIAAMFFVPFVFSGIETTFVLWSHAALSWGEAENGWAYTFMGAVAVAVQMLAVGPLVRLMGERRLALLGGIALGVGACALPFATGFAGVGAALFLIVFAVCVTGSSLNALVSRRAGSREQGAVMGVAQSAGGFGRIMGPVWSGQIFEHAGRDGPFFGSLIAVLAFLVLVARAPRRTPP